MSNKYLERKRVLFIGIGFYDYDFIIKESIEKLGCEVDYFCETPTGFFYTIANFLGISLLLERYKKNKSLDIAQKCRNDYDIILVIKGDTITKEALKIIRERNRKAKAILYLWDSIERVSNFKNIKNCFDMVFSFDRIDAEKNPNILFKPLFYRHEYSIQNKELPTYDLFFIGWVHSDRVALLRKIKKNLELQNVKVIFLILTGKFIRYISSTMRTIRSMIIQKPIPANEVAKYCLKSKAILDLAHPNQTGLTMRSIEVLFGVERKLVTTNKDIINYDFYNENNILVIDRSNLEIPKSFFEKEFQPYSAEIRERLFIENWVKDFVNDNN